MERATLQDLQWWLDLAEDLEWRFATSYASTAPHWYYVPWVTGYPEGWNRATYSRAARVIMTYGEPEMFYSRVNIRLLSKDGRYKYFLSVGTDPRYVLINKAKAEEVYGEQIVPSTASGLHSIYDDMATGYDKRYDTDYAHRENVAIWKLIAWEPALQSKVPSFLDAGCGSGLALDLKLVRKGATNLYRGFDPSQGMLNQLILKHPWAKDLMPETAESYLESEAGDRTFDAVISLFGSPSYFEAYTIPLLAERAEKLAVFMHYIEGYYPDYYDHKGELHEPPATADASREAAAALPGADVFTMNKFQIAVVQK